MPMTTRKRMKQNTCEKCNEPETSEMFQCEKCNKNYHYQCAGIGDGLGNLDWLCHICESEKEEQTSKVYQVKMSFGRHASCKKPLSYLPKNNLQRSHIPSVIIDPKTQIKEILKTLADLKVDVDSKNGRLEEQEALIEIQRQRIDSLSNDLKIENKRIDEQAVIIENQRLRIDALASNLDILKIAVAANIERSTSIIPIEVQKMPQPANQDNHSFVKEKETKKAVSDIFLNLLCMSVEQATLLNDNLSDSTLFCSLDEQFRLLGDDDVKRFVTGIVNRIFSKDVQGQLSWSGKRTKKPAFIGFNKINDLIHFSCKIKFPNYKNVDGNAVLKTIFQNA